MSKTLSMLDPPEVENWLGGNDARIKKRKEMIKNFLSYLHSHKQEFTKENNEEKMIVKNYFSYTNGMKAVSGVFSLSFYFMFLRGIYIFRCYEIANMNKLPVPLRLGAASLVGVFLYKRVYNDYIYNRDLYSLAVKYRNIAETQESKEEASA